ncbi:MAG: HAMP domain-containing protein [Proteobacteria bacterium]|nr:HAMP domain-containing protein [Pseudomonadota bacterium]
MRSPSIKTKLTLLLMITSSLAVLLVSMLVYFWLGRHYQDIYYRDLNNLVEIIGHNCTTALLFDVPEDAETVLRSVDSRKSIVAIRLYGQDHKQFASYEKKALRSKGGDVSTRRNEDGSGWLRVDHVITLKDGTKIGTLVLYDDVRDIAITQRQGAYILVGSALAALIVAFCVAAFMQRRISGPLSSLTETVKRLAGGDLSAWRDIETLRSDELGTLSAAFIDMGQKLENSYRELSEHRQTLEERVNERTEELQHTLAKLTESQTQLVQSEKMAALGHLVSGVAHEVNNNINFISCALPSIARETKKLAGYLDVAEGHSTEVSGAYDVVRIIERLLNNAEEGVRRTVKIVSDLRTFAYPSRGQFTEVDVHHELDLVLALLHYEIAGRVEIRLNYAPGLPLLSCLRDQMNQVYMNVLRNALQAIGRTGRVTISTWLQEGAIHIRFLDSGIGIPESILPRIFDPFFTTKEVGKGMGLGLAISYGIVKKHYGAISVESTGPAGTAFVLRLPVHAGGVTEAASIPESQGTDRRRGLC